MVTRLPPWSAPAARELLRGDDLFVQVGALAGQPELTPWLGLALATALSVLWAFATFSANGWIAARLGQEPVPPNAATA